MNARRLLSTAMIMLIAVSAFAAGTQEGSEEMITLLHWTNDSFSPSTSLVAAKVIYERIYSEFEQENPNIKVRYEVLPGGTEAHQKVLAAASVNQLPDLGSIDGYWVARLVQGDYIVPLNDLWPADDRADFLEDAVKGVTFDGKVYAVWFYNGSRTHVYHKDLVKEAGYDKLPEGRDEFIRAAKKMVGRDRWAVMYSGDKSEYTTLHMLPYFWGYGGDLFDAQGKPAFHEGKNREALRRIYQWYGDMVNTHKFMPAEVVNLNEKQIVDYFYAGQTVVWPTSSSRMAPLRQNRPDLYPKVGIANYPMEQGFTAVGHLSGWTYGIYTKDPARQAAAWKFIAALTNSTNLGQLNQAHGHLPVRKSIVDTNRFFAEDPVFKQFVQLMFGAPIRPRPPVPIYAASSLEIAAQVGPVIMGKMTPDQAIDAAAKASFEEWERTAR
ncbi:MAG: extracellular solute-binding protein [Spirochaetales bacterium]|nr:extracellular solute-binding protein [Spirochaetales bacterium]